MNSVDYRKKRKRRANIRKAIVFFLFALVFILWAFYYLLQSDIFNLDEIEVQGNYIIDSNQLIEKSQLFKNRNIFKYNLKQISQNVVSHPYIKEASIKRKLPKAFIINVKEREEYAIIPYMGSYIYIDIEKVVLNATDSYMAQDKTLITGIDLRSFKLGEKIEATNGEQLMTALILLEAANMAKISEMISEINIGNREDIRIITFDGIEVYLGEALNPPYLMVALRETLINLYIQNIRNVVVDMQYDGNISVRDRNQWEEEE